MGPVRAHMPLSAASLFMLRSKQIPLMHHCHQAGSSFQSSSLDSHHPKPPHQADGGAMALPCAVFETQPNRGHGSPLPCAGAVLCTGKNRVLNADALEQPRLWGYTGFAGVVMCKPHTNGCMLRADLHPAPHCSARFSSTGVTRMLPQRLDLCPRLPRCPMKSNDGFMASSTPQPYLSCNKTHLQALLNWCESQTTSLMLEEPCKVSDKNEAKCSCPNPSL